MPINTQLSMQFDENTNTDVDMDMDYDAEEDSFMEGFSFESSQPQVDVVSWQNSQPSRDLMELAQRVPNRRNFKHRPTPTLLWDDYTSNNQQSTSSTGTISSTSHSGLFSRSSSLPGSSFSKSGQSSSTSASSSIRPGENTVPAATKKTPVYFAPVEATTVKLRRATTTQHLSRAMPAPTSVGRSDVRHASTSSLQYGGTKGKEREKEMGKPRRSEPAPAPARIDTHPTRNTDIPHQAHQPNRNTSGFARSLSSSSSTSSHPSSVEEGHTRGNTPDTSMSMDIDCPGSQGSGSTSTSTSALAAQILASLPKHPNPNPDPNPPKSKPNPRPPPPPQADPAKPQPAVRLHPLLLQKTSSSSSSSLKPNSPHSPILPSPSQSHPHIQKQPPATQSSHPSRRPVLGMCRRTHTFPSSQQPGSGSGAGAGTGVKKFRPPLLSQLPQSQSGAAGPRTSTTAATGLKPQPPQQKASRNQKDSKRSPSPEPAIEADSSFGDMSFDMDALEETMKQYD